MVASPFRMRADRVLVEAGQRPAHDVLRQSAEGAERRRGLLRQIEAMRAPVGRVVAALDEAGRGQLVDQAAEGDRREVERFGEFALLGALAALQPRQHRPLGAGRVELARPLVGIGAQEARHVVQREGEFAAGRVRRDYKQVTS